MIKTLTSIALAVAALAASPVCAQSAAVIGETKVSFADLNLDSAAGRATLGSRIKGAAKMVCGPAQAPSLAEARETHSCVKGAIAGANNQLEQVLASRGSSTVVAVRR